MKARTRFARIPALLLGALLLLSLGGAAQIPANTERGRALSKRLMCLCGCNQILGECNHVGCSMSTAMLKRLDQLVLRGDADDLVLSTMVQEYGTKALAQPPAEGFTLIAWIMPVVVVIVGTFIVRTAIVRWRRQPAVATAGPPVDPELVARAVAESERDDWPQGGR